MKTIISELVIFVRICILFASTKIFKFCRNSGVVYNASLLNGVVGQARKLKLCSVTFL